MYLMAALDDFDVVLDGQLAFRWRRCWRAK
jgi:hypothetical protein